jgi:uncharacterized phosphatase
MKKLYFVRHGLTEMNVAGVWSGHTETDLTPKGRKQAQEAGKRLKTKKLKIDYVVASPLMRARETAEIIAKEIGYPVKAIEINPLFIERHFGELEGQPYAPDLNLDGIANIESSDTLLHRARRALAYLESLKEENILVVAHGSIGRAIRHNITNGEISYHNRNLPLKNAEIHEWR